MDYNFLVEYLSSTVRVAVPIILVAVGVCYCEKAGVFAMGSEGQMLISAFVAVIVTVFSGGNHFLGVISGILAGALAAAIFASLTVFLGAHQVICGLGMNFVFIGLSSFLQRLFWGVTGIPRIPAMDPIPLPLLSQIPLIGDVLFNQPILTYCTYVIVPVAWWFMYRSTWGLQLRAVGENPRCADTVGIPVRKTKVCGILISGAMCGLAGSVLALQQVQSFTENMTAGRGWLGLIAATFGGWNPLIAAGAGIIFGAADALQLRAQIFLSNVSSYVILMAPYLIALISILFVSKGARHPDAMGKHYTQE